MMIIDQTGQMVQGVHYTIVFTLYMLDIYYDINFQLLYHSFIWQIFFSDFYVPVVLLSSDARAIKITNIASVTEVTF